MAKMLNVKMPEERITTIFNNN